MIRNPVPSLAAAALLTWLSPFAGTANAADISDAFYLDLSGGPAAFMLHMNEDAVDDLIADTYWGIDGRLGICSKGPINLCGGMTGFMALGDATREIETRAGGGKTDTQLSSIGAYVAARGNLGLVSLSPYAGYRQVFGGRASRCFVNSLGRLSCSCCAVPVVLLNQPNRELGQSNV